MTDGTSEFDGVMYCWHRLQFVSAGLVRIFFPKSLEISF
jgi:hypothetical protein